MDKLNLHSPDLTQRNVNAIAELFPTVVTETLDAEGNAVRAVDFDALRQELSDHIVEGPQERYQLDWPGKRAAAFAANAPIAKTLRPVGEESVNFDTTRNLFIEGDNLDALKLLQESYLGKVKLIYIDPPYNTGNDFVYEDDFAESSAEYLARSGQRSKSGARLVANTESNGRFHSDWLSMIYPRLKLARSFLAHDGVIFISIDDNEASALRLIADEIFGAANFVAQVVWQKRTSPESRRRLGAGHEYLLAYVRDSDHLGNALGLLPLTDADRASYSNPDNDPRGAWVSSDFTAQGFRPNQVYTITTPGGAEYTPAAGRCWKNIESEYRRQLTEGRFWFGADGRGVPRRKTYLGERLGKAAWTWWPNAEVGHTQEATREVRALFGNEDASYFEYPKPVRLLERVVSLATQAHTADVVLDFFAGSGTTAQAVLRANARDGGNRRFIMVQIDEPTPDSSVARADGYETIAQLTRERIRRAATLESASAGLNASELDWGFRALRVDTTNFADNRRVPDELTQASLLDFAGSIEVGRTSEDVLFEVLLAWGIDLSVSISREAGEVYSVDEGALVASLGDDISDDLVRSLAARHPLRAVFKDSAFATDAARINVEQLFRELSPESEVRAI